MITNFKWRIEDDKLVIEYELDGIESQQAIQIYKITRVENQGNRIFVYYSYKNREHCIIFPLGNDCLKIYKDIYFAIDAHKRARMTQQEFIDKYNLSCLLPSIKDIPLIELNRMIYDNTFYDYEYIVELNKCLNCEGYKLQCVSISPIEENFIINYKRIENE